MANIIVLIIVGAALALSVYSMIRRRKNGKTACGCDCGGCVYHCGCGNKDDRRK